MEKIQIFDTTLRDGEQSPGATMTLEEKLKVAKYLDQIGVDVVEAGYAAASDEDLKSIQEISKILNGPEVASLGRVYKNGSKVFPDIDASYEALRYAKKPRLHVFIATSPQHIQAKFPGKTLNDVIDLAVEGIKYGINKFENDGRNVVVEFSPEDAARTSKEDLIKVVRAVTQAGATVINIPDTVGYTMPNEFAAHIKAVYDAVPLIQTGRSIISVHCHNDLGCATANALEAVLQGHAKQIECSLTGLGERGGMSYTEQVVMAMKTRPDLFGKEAVSHINPKAFFEACRYVKEIINSDMLRDPIFGDTAFAHEAGIHQHGQLKGEESGMGNVYEIMTSADIGWVGEKIVLGKHSGWHAVNHKLDLLGYKGVTTEDAKLILTEIKQWADKQKYVYDHDLDRIMIGLGKAPNVEDYQIDDWRPSSGQGIGPQVSIKMKGPNVNPDYVVGQGNGLVDAAIHAISKATSINPKDVLGYKVRSLRSGSDAQARAILYIRESNGVELHHMGVGVNTDIVKASMDAYVNALNRMHMYHTLTEK